MFGSLSVFFYSNVTKIPQLARPRPRTTSIKEMNVGDKERLYSVARLCSQTSFSLPGLEGSRYRVEVMERHGQERGYHLSLLGNGQGPLRNLEATSSLFRSGPES